MGTSAGAGVTRVVDKAGCFWTVGKEVWASHWFTGTLQLYKVGQK